MGNTSSVETTSGKYNLKDFNNLRNTLGNRDNLEITNRLNSLEDLNINYTPSCQEAVDTFFYLGEEIENNDSTNNDNTEENAKENTEENTKENTEENTETNNSIVEKVNNSGYLNNVLVLLNNHILKNFLLNKDNEDLSVFKEINGVRLLKYEETEIKGDRSNELELYERYSLGSDSSESTRIYNISTVYEMPENTIGFYNRRLGRNIEDCYLGYSKNRDCFEVYSSRGEYESNRTFRFEWLVYDNGDNVSVLLNNLSGVVLDNSGEIVKENENYFTNLESAYLSMENNNAREMNSYINRFNQVKEELISGDEVMAIVGGVESGEMLSLGNFLENLDL